MPDGGDRTVSDASAEGGVEHDAGEDAARPVVACETAFDTFGTFELDAEGRTTTIGLSFDEQVSSLAIAITADGENAQSSCYGLEAVRAGDAEWVPVGSDDSEELCAGCAQLVRVHPDQGFFVFPSTTAVAPFDALSLRVAMRDCASLLRPSSLFPLGAPTRVRVQTRVIEARPADETLTLHVGLVVAAPSLLELDGALRTSYLDGVKKTVEDAFSAADIAIAWSVVETDGSVAKVEFAPEERTELDALFTASKRALGVEQDGLVPLVLGPCLERKSVVNTSRPFGTTPHLPGSCSVERAGVYVAAESCLGGGLSFTDGAAAGVIAAHELGHHLGLFHVEDASFPTDRSASDGNLMVQKPAGSVALTAQQIAVLRRHPDLRRAPAP